jgi:hypothetical protein
MLDQLMQMIQQTGQQSVVENTDVPNEHNDAVLGEAQKAITSGLKGLASTGELNQLVEQSAQNPKALAGNPAVQNISNNFMGNIMEKFGISKTVASSIAASLIPMVMGKMMSGSQQADTKQAGGFDLGGLLGSLTAGATPQAGQPSGGGIMNTLSNLGAKFGLDKDGDGDVDMSDLSKLIK